MLKNLIKKQEIHPEEQYLHMIRELLDEGNIENGRNGNVKALFGATMRFNLTNNIIPLILILATIL